MDNPFAAKHGTEKDEWGDEVWVSHLSGTSALAGVACIKELVKHVAIKSRDFFKGTKRENDWHFYHDALSQLTHKDTVAWMKATIIPGTTRSIHECWIAPELDLNIAHGCFHGRPVGDSAEVMPLDHSLNEDLHESSRFHVVCSRSGLEYTCKDPRLFSFATPKEVSRVYRRIFHPKTGVSPLPERIVQDVHKAVNAMKVIHQAKGAFVPGLAGGRVPGQRHTATEERTSSNWGGKRVKKILEELDNSAMHADLRSLLDDPTRDVTQMFAREEDEGDW